MKPCKIEDSRNSRIIPENDKKKEKHDKILQYNQHFEEASNKISSFLDEKSQEKRTESENYK